MDLPLLGGPWVVINGVIIRVTILISHIRGLVTPFMTTHEPPSRPTERASANSRRVPWRVDLIRSFEGHYKGMRVTRKAFRWVRRRSKLWQKGRRLNHHRREVQTIAEAQAVFCAQEIPSRKRVLLLSSLAIACSH